jgi:O-antigen/teichoic acid export membrane protein
MLPILMAGSWFSILCALNESTLMGVGRPSYAAVGNLAKFGWLLVALPFSFEVYGAIGAIGVIAISDAWRYAAGLIGQRRERLNFAKQDAAATALLVGLVALWTAGRWFAGLGLPR